MVLKSLLGVGVALVILGVLDTIENGGSGHIPFQMDGRHRVTNVQTTAARAGISVGDVLTHIDTVDVNARRTLLAQPRAGEARSYTFIRAGTAVRVDLSHPSMSQRARILSALAAVAGVLFLVFPLWAVWRNPAATPLAISGLGFGAAILGAPDLRSNSLALFVFNARWLAAIIGAAGCLHFLATFPKPTRVLARPRAVHLLYAPAAVVLGEYLISAVTVRSWANVIGFTWFLSLLAYSVGVGIMLVSRFRTGKDNGTRRMASTAAGLLGLLPLYAVLRGAAPGLASDAWPPWGYFAVFVLSGVPIAFARAAGRTPASNAGNALR